MQQTPKATHEGTLKLPVRDYATGQNLVIEGFCANLDNGFRVIAESAFLELVGRSPTYRRNGKNDKRSGCVKLPPFLEADNLQPFIDKQIVDASKPIPYITKTNTLAKGYSSELLPQVCCVYRAAYKAKALRKSQEHIYQRCDIISDALIRVAVDALIDEATGYQYDRPKNTLEALLELYVASTPNKWMRQFQESFYKEIARLKGWNYTPGSRTGAFAHITVDLVYKRIQSGLWDELKRNNPDKKKYRYHQILTEHIGNPHLREHLRAITNLMRGCSSWNQFMAIVNHTYPSNNIQMDIFFDLLIESPGDFEKYKDLVS